MRALIYSIPCLILIFTSCNQNIEKELSPAEKHMQDSLARLTRELRVDSMKKKNPLLIVPPDSLYSGDYIDKYTTGIIKYKGYFRLGQRHGQWMSFYPSGSMWSQMQYDKGLRHGMNAAYFESGILRYSGFYRDDKRDSLWTYYDSTGVLRKKLLFKKDRVIKEFPIESPKGFAKKH